MSNAANTIQIHLNKFIYKLNGSKIQGGTVTLCDTGEVNVHFENKDDAFVFRVGQMLRQEMGLDSFYKIKEA